MNYIFKIILLLILILNLDIIAKNKNRPKLLYGISLSYIFDSNIGQNINETSANYVVPKLSFKLKNLTSLPWYIRSNFIFDAYQQKRVPTLNSPFVNVGSGFNFKKNMFKYNPEFSAILYVGINVDINTDSIIDMKNFIPVKRSLKLKNNFNFKLKRNLIKINTSVRYNDFYESTHATSEDEWRIEILPKYSYRFKILKKENIKIRNLFTELEYEGNFSFKSTESYNMLGITAGLELKFFITSLNIAGRVAQKKFNSSITLNNKSISPINKYAYLITSLDIPIISNLEFVTGAKLRFKGSNNPSYDYDRHTVFAKLKWNSSIGGKKKE